MRPVYQKLIRFGFVVAAVVSVFVFYTSICRAFDGAMAQTENLMRAFF